MRNDQLQWAIKRLQYQYGEESEPLVSELRQLAERQTAHDGWQLARAEPKQEMIEAGARSLRADISANHRPQHRTLTCAARNCYVTMLAADKSLGSVP